MVEIFICEDDARQKKRLTEYVEDYVYDEERKRLVKMELRISTDNPQEILNYVKEHEAYGLYFLDVDLNKEINGIELANEIRKYDKKGEIIFITTHGEMMPLTFEYKVKALDYIIKGNVGNIEEKVIKCMDLVNERYQFSKDRRIFHFKKGEKLISEEYDNILYFEKVKGKPIVVMHTKNGLSEFKGTLKEIEKLDNCLCRCSNDILVNIDNISEFDKKNKEIYLVDGSICYPSVRLSRNLTNALDKRRSRH